jgi:hypothetical protein
LFPSPLFVFSFVDWQIVFAVVKVAASVMDCTSEFLQLFAEMNGCNSDACRIIFSRGIKH